MITGLWAVSFMIGAVAAGQDAAFVHRLDYDRNAPLYIKEAAVEQRDDIAIHDISYASPKGGSVPAYLVVPSGKGPFAAVIWGHWYWENSEFRNRKEFLAEAIALGHAGVVSLLTDGPIARPGHVNKAPLNKQQMTDMIQQIVDRRRGADLQLARKDVDQKRLAYVGHSYNASVGGFLSGIDKRFKAFVLMAGGLSDELDLKTKEVQDYRQKIGPEKFDAFTAKWKLLDPGKFVFNAGAAAGTKGAIAGREIGGRDVRRTASETPALHSGRRRYKLGPQKLRKIKCGPGQPPGPHRSWNVPRVFIA